MSDRPGISLDEWYPFVKGLVPTPETVVISSVDMAPLLYQGDGGGPDIGAEWNQLVSDITFAAESLGGFPVFLRTGLFSGKHDWENTCHIPDAAAVAQHVFNIVEGSELADLIGLPSDVWVVRELLDTAPAFYAFDGKMPITQERRYFFADGNVVGHHPYWPPEAIHSADRVGWPQYLDDLNRESETEIKLLTYWTEQVAAVIPGAWSVDWLLTRERGWFLTDMAWAEASFVWEEYPTAPRDAW